LTRRSSKSAGTTDQGSKPRDPARSFHILLRIPILQIGIFTPLTLNEVSPYLRGFAVADLNADGSPGMAVAGGEPSELFKHSGRPG